MGAMRIDFTAVPQPVAMRFDVPMTDDELIAFSEQNKPWRFERERNGEISIMTPVGGISGTHEMLVSAALSTWKAGEESGVVFPFNVGFNLPDGSCLAPDAAWLSIDRWHGLTREQRTGFPPLCPEFVVEVRSPEDARKAVELKMQRWIASGAQLAWLIDPLEKQVVIYRPSEATETLDSPDLVRGHAPVEDFELDLRPIWDME